MARQSADSERIGLTGLAEGVRAASLPAPPRRARLRAAVACGLLALSAHGVAHAESLAGGGCPMFHCTLEATETEAAPLVSEIEATVSNSTLGTLVAQGCSGDGTNLMCLFNKDAATGAAQGTLKLIDGTTLQPIWGTAGVPGSYNLVSRYSANGQVPVVFADGTIAAGDALYEVLYDGSGNVLVQLPLGGATNATNFGLTPISDQYGIVSRTNGALTLIDFTTWTVVGSLTLVDPTSGLPLHLVSPSSGAPGVLYAVATNPATGAGYLFSVGVNPTGTGLAVLSTFAFTGVTGASAVIATPDVTGLGGNLVLLNAPGTVGQSPPVNQLLGLLDTGSGTMTEVWSIPLDGTLTVAPTFDPVSLTMYYQQKSVTNLYQADLLSGTPLQVFDVQTLATLPSTFVLNGHLGASQGAGPFTLLLSGGSTGKGRTAEQYVMAFLPLASPPTFQWISAVKLHSASYAAAWNFVPSSQPGTVCPVAITDAGARYSDIVRLCDF